MKRRSNTIGNLLHSPGISDQETKHDEKVSQLLDVNSNPLEAKLSLVQKIKLLSYLLTETEF